MPQLLRLYLIRHGEVEGAAAGKLLGFTDPPLSGRGVEQARLLAVNLAATQLSAIYSSDLLRAQQTAGAIAEGRRMKVQLRSTLREINMGEWEGRTMAAVHAEAPEKVGQLFTDPSLFQYPGGESFANFTERVQVALEQLIATHQIDEIAVVAHGGVCRAIIGTVLGMPMRNWLRLAQDHGCLNVIEWYDANPMLRLLNGRLESGAGSRASRTAPKPSQPPHLVEGEDYYYEGAMMVFTARYHLRRGYCCQSGCRHCPYGEAASR
ncbi:MAG TPA: histidine phosphatase family protein [Blastocatellia bacterium]|jgi:broad specificity phosphatase PhoE